MTSTYLGLNLEEAAEELRCSEWTVRKLVREGHLPKVPHMGTRIVIPRDAIRRFMREASRAS